MGQVGDMARKPQEEAPPTPVPATCMHWGDPGPSFPHPRVLSKRLHPQKEP